MSPQQQEFLKILSNYQGIIYKVCLIYFRSETDREDNFQEIVYQLWKSFPSLRNRDKIASWIYSVAINTSISKRRKDSKLEFYDSVPEPTPPEPDEGEGQAAHYQRLLDAIRKLGPIDRSIMLLYMEDYTYGEISQILGMSLTHIGVKIHRLKNQLQKQLKNKE